MSEKPASSKRRSITLDVKRQIVVLIENKIKSQADIVREYSLSKSTVSAIWMNREKYKSSVQFADSRKKMRKSSYEDIEDALFVWLQHARSVGTPLSSAILKEKATSLANELGYRDFKCSVGWLHRFKKRRAAILRILDGEAESVPQELADDSQANIEIPIEVKVEPADITCGQTDDEFSNDEAPAELSPSPHEANMALMLLQRYIEYNTSDPAEAEVMMSCLSKLDAYVAKTAQANEVHEKMTGYFDSR